MPSSTERSAIDEATGDLSAEAVSLLRDLVRTPSVNPPGDYEAVREVLTDAYESYDWDVSVEYAPDDLLADCDLPHPRPNVLAYPTRGSGPTVALNAHLDTVPVDESKWSTDPFGATVEDGRVYGRGAYDSKGRIAAYTLAARALERADLLPEDATLVLVMTADEETGGRAGAEYVVENGLVDADYAIVEGASTEVHHAACGVVHLEVTATGESAHAKNPADGTNAILAMNSVLASVGEFAADLADLDSDVAGMSGPTCNVGTIEGGTKTNVVPSSCSATIDLRIPPDHDADEVRRRLLDAIDAADVPDGAEIDVETVLEADSYRFEPDAEHVEVVRENAAGMLGRDLPVVGTQGFTDARFFAADGVETVKYGPGDDRSNAHGADESVAVDQIRETAAVVAGSVLDFADR